MMKKNIVTALVLAVGMLMSAPAYAEPQETETEDSFAIEGQDSIIGGADGPTDIMVGGWDSNTGDTSIDAKENADAKKAFEKAMDGFDGDSFEVVAYLGSQVVAGTNYGYLCRETSDEPDPVTTFVLLTVYEDLDGNAGVKDIMDVFPFWDDEYEYSDGDQIETEDDCFSSVDRDSGTENENTSD